MTVKAKRFRIGVEGATTDGREIQREWLEQMAASYNPAVYTALINLEHIKSYLPDSTFNRYGKVTALFAEEITEGPLAGKMALYADVEPTESLVELVKKGQKLFTSMEVSPKFADTGKAYLVGLAATDDPASLGTEMLTFSASAAHNPLANRKQNPANLFTAAEETVIELEEIQEDKPSLFARVTALFTKKEQSDDARFSDVHKAVELVATEQQNLSVRTEKSLSEQEERLSELETALQEQQPNLQDNKMNDKQTEKTIQLDTPIMRGKTEVTEIVLRKPQSGALRGTRLQAIMDMDVNAMMTVIPRISSPALTAQEIAEMDPADLTAMSVEVVTFLLKKSVLAGLPTA